jgi:uncharacterized membrane protein
MNIKFRKNNSLKYFAIIGILVTLFSFYQIVQAETEIINNFNVKIVIQKDGTIFVTEKITYNFGSNQKHGIFRDIPLTSVNGPRLKIDVSKVTNELGEPYKYTISIKNDVLRIKIGDPDVFVSGAKTYVINYKVYNAIRKFEDHDELYWNVTGNQWPVAIQNANASIVLPDSSMPNVRMDCFTGVRGSTQKNCTFQQNDSNINYLTSQSLDINEGLTIVLGLPLGYIDNTYVSSQQTYSVFYSMLFSIFEIIKTLDLNINLGSLYSMLFFVIFVLIFFESSTQIIKIIKPKPVVPKGLKNRPIVVEYNPPDNLSPIEIGTLLNRRVDITDISSVIIDLAVRGYLKIRYIPQTINSLVDKKDFELIKLKDGADLIKPTDKKIFSILFRGRDSVRLSYLKKNKTILKSDINKIKEDMEQYLYKKGYFDQTTKNKLKKLKTYLFSTIFVLCIGFLILTILQSKFKPIFMSIITVLSIVSPIIIVVLVIVSSNPKLTKKGISTLEKILGFKEFLELTEKDRLRLLNAPELQPEMFEKFLPYAMVLGVEDKWAKKFEEIYDTTPDWYEGSIEIKFNSSILTRELKQFNNYSNRSLGATYPRLSNRFSSGFSGGGSSGGGSGGGGGGSW